MNTLKMNITIHNNQTVRRYKTLEVLMIFHLLMGVHVQSQTNDSASLNNSPKHQKPNVILIMADDMGIGDLSFLNSGLNNTPSLKNLKDESVFFTNAYSSSAVCAPARAAMLTGMYPHRTGVVTLSSEKHPKLTRIKKQIPTMANAFKQNGYKTALIGKWHTGVGEDYHPLKRGFDIFEGFSQAKQIPSYFDYSLDVNGTTIHESDKYLTRDLSERAINFIRNNKEHPFFLHLAHYAPHRPIGAPKAFIEKYRNKGFDIETSTVYAMIEIIDETIGKLLLELKKLNLEENTIVIFTSDNGPDPMVHKRYNLNLKGSKYTVYEGGIHVPFMMQWKNHLEPRETDKIITFIDVLPTLVKICDLKFNTPFSIDGRSFLNSKQEINTSKKHDAFFWQWNRYLPNYNFNAAVQLDKWKLVRPFTTKNIPKPNTALPAVLYHLKTDLNEQHDVAKQYPKKVKKLTKLLDSWTLKMENDRIHLKEK
jgi:arylsulfatase A